MKMNSIQTRLMTVAFVFIMGTSLAMGLIGIRLTSNFLSRRFHQNFKVLAAYMARNAELGVLLNDQSMLERLGGNLLEEKDIHGVTVFDDEGQVIARVRKEPFREAMFSVESPIMTPQLGKDELMFGEVVGHEAVGRVNLTYSGSGLDRLIKVMAIRFMLISFLLSLIPVICYRFLAKSIVAPLNDLVQVSKAVSKGQMDIRARGGRLLETRTLAATFNEMLNELKRKQKELQDAQIEISRQQTLAEVGKFSMMVAHEIKNPLAVIKGSLDILKKDSIDASTQKMMQDYMEDEIVRINTLVEDFLLFARPRKPDFVELEMNGFVSDLVHKAELWSQEKKKTIDMYIEPMPCVVSCDPALMERAMLNIIRNAFDMDPSAKPLVVMTVSTSNQWTFMVKDAGPGIAPEHLGTIFDPFFTTQTKGTGLGLALTREIVAAHGGEIRARNRKSGGAAFEIRLKKHSASIIRNED